MKKVLDFTIKHLFHLYNKAYIVFTSNLNLSLLGTQVPSL